jgi:hypothetical protein
MDIDCTKVGTHTVGETSVEIIEPMLAGRTDSRFYGSGESSEIVATVRRAGKVVHVTVEGERYMESDGGDALRDADDYREAFATDAELQAAAAGEGGWSESANNWFSLDVPGASNPERFEEAIEEYDSAVAYALQVVAEL